MLRRISCTRCRLGSLWTDEPAEFLATVCRSPARCEATLRDEEFATVRAVPGAPEAPRAWRESIDRVP